MMELIEMYIIGLAITVVMAKVLVAKIEPKETEFVKQRRRKHAR